jgi:hypothetical protein
MNYLYQYSLRQRLKYIVGRFNFLLKQFNEKTNEFVNRVVNTRNYYVHFDELLKSEIITDEQFAYYNHILRVLLDAFLLNELGLTDEQILKFVKRQSQVYRVRK